LKTPSSSYYLKVQNDTTMKEVSWNDNSVMDSAIAAKLNEMVWFLTDMIENKPEFQRWPPANGAYL
jgi:hypothetical protein